MNRIRLTKEKAKNIVRGITDKIEATTDIDAWAEFWGFTRDDYEEFLEMAIKALGQERSRSAEITQYRHDCEKLMEENERLKKALEQEPCEDKEGL